MYVGGGGGGGDGYGVRVERVYIVAPTVSRIIEI